ncbi:CHAT domain-containing protein [Aulosira sp. FACHB-615]|uniref:CHAT domain-containing protein n=1 Tax=Aulosira sp. FACHB-615 TaxID=2692777 RepID=UPI0016871519|nr:CHAT domain-containing protein [Aulosira sp. FACHB-615]MBD2489918.1 CHAT domain-containing protein [Aulosira sp. FACHB-615]
MSINFTPSIFTNTSVCLMMMAIAINIFAHNQVLASEQLPGNILGDRMFTLAVNSATEQIRQVAKQQNATLIQYSIINNEFTIAGKKQTRESELYIWVIKPTGDITFRQVDIKALWQKQNTSLSELIAQSRLSLGVTGNYNYLKRNQLKDNFQKLHELLIKPIENLLPQQPNTNIIFIPQGELFLVPFAALQDAKGKYLIERYTIATAPSIQALDLLYQRKKQYQNIGQDILVVGNPKIQSDRGEPLQLIGAEQEAKAIAQLFNTQPLIGNAATETAVVQRISQAKIIHLATQAYLKNQQGLAFTPSTQDDGLLTPAEIQKLKLTADLVVLSANDTAIGIITNDGVIGLSRSFLSAGVSSVIASLWDISDQSTAYLMTKFYQKLHEKPDKAAALRYAMLETKKKYPNPRDWAAFTLIGLL